MTTEGSVGKQAIQDAIGAGFYKERTIHATKDGRKIKLEQVKVCEQEESQTQKNTGQGGCVVWREDLNGCPQVKV